MTGPVTCSYGGESSRLPSWFSPPNGPNVAARLARLIDAAQADGVFGVPGHEIRLWHGGDPDIYADGYFITIQPPSGPALARGPLTDADLLGRNARGVEAGLNALNHVGRVANAVLADQHAHLRAVHATANASTGPPQPHTSSAHRAFAAPPTQLRAPAGEAPSSPPTASTELRPSQHR